MRFSCLILHFNIKNMFIYNITYKIDWSIHDAWLQWMQDIHIPETLGTGCFSRHILLRLVEVDEEEGPTYAIQYFADSKAQYTRFQTLYAAGLQLSETKAWSNKFLSFGTIMQVVN